MLIIPKVVTVEAYGVESQLVVTTFTISVKTQSWDKIYLIWVNICSDNSGIVMGARFFPLNTL